MGDQFISLIRTGLTVDEAMLRAILLAQSRFTDEPDHYAHAEQSDAADREQLDIEYARRHPGAPVLSPIVIDVRHLLDVPPVWADGSVA